MYGTFKEVRNSFVSVSSACGSCRAEVRVWIAMFI
jgi:bacterioferritin-associated ferredoxin